MHDVYEYTHGVWVHVGHGMHEEVDEQLIGVASLLPLRETQGANSGCQMWQQVHL